MIEKEIEIKFKVDGNILDALKGIEMKSYEEADEYFTTKEMLENSTFLRFRKKHEKIILIMKAITNAKNEIYPTIDDNTLFVTQGFIGADNFGNTTTLGREGSDYSAALFGEAINASLVEVWTDVAGISSSDPRLIENVKFIKELS